MILALGLYIAAVVVLYKYRTHHLYSTFFKALKQHSWLAGGLSIFMIQLSVDQGQLLTGVIGKHGFGGMWVFWAGMICTFVIPYVFAPYWKKLDFITDNQFLLFRFPGKGGKILYVFRAVYVGLIVVSILLSFHFLAMARVWEAFFHMEKETALLCSSLILALYVLVNRMDFKIQLDTLHAFIYLGVFALIFYYVYQYAGGFAPIENYFSQHPSKKELFPSAGDSYTVFAFITYIGIQWWSVNMFDGGGPQMARYTAVASKRDAIKAGLLPVLVSKITTTAMLFLVLMVLAHSNSQKEVGFLEETLHAVPSVLHGVLFVGFLVVFISSTESLINWGGGFLTVDFYKKSILKQEEEMQTRDWSSVFFMLLILTCASIFAFYSDNLEQIFKVILSISAGVAPVYILRWFWYRVNAWAQLTAMFSSLVFTSTYTFWYEWLDLTRLPYEESRIVFVTLVTTALWLSVLLFTKQETNVVHERMQGLIGSKKRFLKRLATALLFGFLLLCLVVGFWLWMLG